MKNPPRKAEFEEGQKALDNFIRATKKILSAPKSRVLEIEAESKKKRKP